MGDEHEKKSNEIKDQGEAKKNVEAKESKVDSTKNAGCERTCKGLDNKSSENNAASFLSVAEKTIKELYDTVSKKISDFVANDFQQLKNVSKDEWAKLNSSLSEYKNELEKLSQEKIKRIGEMKNKLQTSLITTEEVQHFMKFIDERIAKMNSVTEKFSETLMKNEATKNFVKDLQSVVTEYGKKIANIMNDIYTVLKELAGNLGRSVSDKENLQAKLQNIPTTSDLQKIPSMLTKMFKGGSKSFTDSTAKKVFLPVARLREKLPALNISKHFNNHTMQGRANVAKATYAGILLYFIYWKMTKAKS